MKRKDFEALRKKSASELTTLLEEKRRELLELRFSHATGALENPAKIGQVKRDVAKILTVTGEQRLLSTTGVAEKGTV